MTVRQIAPQTVRNKTVSYKRYIYVPYNRETNEQDVTHPARSQFFLISGGHPFDLFIICAFKSPLPGLFRLALEKILQWRQILPGIPGFQSSIVFFSVLLMDDNRGMYANSLKYQVISGNL